jgi:ketosteroid isomerase-like protein
VRRFVFRETIIYRWLAAGDAGDFDAFDELLHPDAVVHAPRGLSTTSREAEKGARRYNRGAALAMDAATRTRTRPRR